MFLARVAKNLDMISCKDRVNLIHLAENNDITLCSRYQTRDIIQGQYLKNILGGISLPNYLNLICNNKIENYNICKLCLNKYMKSGYFC